jgi:formiminotetrahydrofolate cyclodeaminase
MKLIEQTIIKYSELLASPHPTPGGGTSSSLSALLGSAFLTMIARISAGKKSSAAQKEELKKIEADAESLRLKFLALIDKDTESYNNIIAVRRFTKSIEGEKIKSAEKLQAALKEAVKTPFELLQNSLAALFLASSLSNFYYTGIASDLGIAANCLLTAARGAHLTILININSINDDEFNEYYLSKSENTLHEAEKIACQIYSDVKELLLPQNKTDGGWREHL